MDEIRVADASSGKSYTLVTLIYCAAVVLIAYAVDRAYRRWVKENLAPFPRYRAAAQRMRRRREQRRESAALVAQVVRSPII